MSWQIQSAVGRKSTHITDGVGKLLYRLAEYATEDGVIDPAPNQETMAAWYGVSSRTVRNWVNTLIASGELVQLRIGKGPGQTSAYRILLNLTPEELSQSPKPKNRNRIEESAAASLNERMSQIEETIKGFVSGINERLSAIENQLEEYRKKEETNAAFVSGIRDRLEVLENLIPEKPERNTGNATRSNVQTIYNDLNNRKNTHPQTPSRNGNGGGSGRNGASDDDRAAELFWGDVLGLCDDNKQYAGAVFILATKLAEELTWAKPIPGPSTTRQNRKDAIDGWWSPIVRVLKQCEWQSEVAFDLFRGATSAMRGRDFSPSRPSGVMGEIGKLLAVADGLVISGKNNGSQEPAFVDPSWPTQGGTW